MLIANANSDWSAISMLRGSLWASSSRPYSARQTADLYDMKYDDVYSIVVLK